MISFSLRNAIVAILLASVSAKATALDNNEDLHIDEEARVDNVLEVNSRRAQTNRIVGGNQAAQGKYPYFVEWVRRGCAASLIHTDIVLSAAHCNGSNLPTGVIVSAYQPGLAINGAQSRTIVQRVQHPNYSSSTNKNDFLIMRLDSPVTGITPVALNGDSQIPAAGDMLTVIGFGDLKNGGQIYPDFLQEVNVPYVTHSKCNQQYSGSIDEVSMLCAGYDQGGKDSCQGDSGGPIVRIVNGVHTQVGVVSWGDGCALVGKPGVYSRTSGQIAWIQAQVCAMTKTNPKPAYCAGSPTPAPTTQAPTVTPGVTPAPTQAPTEAPTVNPGSTRAPTRAPTRRVPTRAPTPSPTTGSGCVDDPTAYFYINGRYRNCAWFAARPTFQDYYCGWDSEPDYYCQKTCDSCLYWGGGRSL